MRIRKKGFTLIELLVVVSIIGTLAAILFPVFANARDRARQITCLSNVRQLSMAIFMYAQDYDEVLISSVHRIADEGGGSISDDMWPIWPAYLRPYVENEEVYICPEVAGVGRYVETWGERGWASVGLNRDIENRFTNVPYSLVWFDEPSRTILLADSTPGETDKPIKARGFQIIGDREPNTQAAISDRHNEGTNVGFLDGHAKWHKASRIWQLDNPEGLLWTR